MKSPLVFLKALDAAYRDAHPAEALRRWFTDLPGTLDAENRAHFDLFLRAVRDACDGARTEAGDKAATPPLGLRLEMDAHCLATGDAHAQGLILARGNLIPGDYRLSTTTGWVLWESALTARELVWSHAYPDEALPLAAASDDAGTPEPALERELLDGQLRVRVYPGPESGRLEVIRHA